MSSQRVLNQIWDADNNTLGFSSRRLAEMVREKTGKTPNESTVNVYRCQFRKNNQIKARIEEACNMLIAENASFHDMMAAGLQFVVLKAA